MTPEKAAGVTRRYEMVLCLEHLQESDMFRTDRLCVVPAGRYLRKDGNRGRIEAAAWNRCTEPGPPETERLARCYRQAGERPLPLEDWLFLLSSGCGIDWFFLDNRSCRPVLREKVSSCAVRFELAGIDAGGEARFRPLISLNNGGVSGPESWMGSCSPRQGYWFNFTGLELYYTDHPESHHTALQVLLASDSARYSLEDITSLKERLSFDFFNVDFPYDNVVIEQKEPGVVMELQFRESVVRGRLFFRYGTRLAAYEETGGDYIRCEGENGRSIRLLRRCPDFELGRYMDIKELSDRRLDPWSIAFDFDHFVDTVAGILIESGVLLYARDEDGALKALRAPGRWNIEVSSGTDWLELKLLADGKEVGWDASSSGRIVKVGGEYILIDSSVLAKLEKIRSQGKHVGAAVRVSPRNLSIVEEIDGLVLNPDHPGLLRMKQALIRLKDIGKRTSTVPGMLKANLRHYQEQAYAWLDFLSECGFGGILADDMGLGKTVQSLSLLAKYLERDAGARFLVVAPVSTLGNWAGEITRFLPGVRYTLHRGGDRVSEAADLPEGGIVLTSYATLQRDLDLLGGITWTLVVFDESQALKNIRTKTYKAARALTAGHILALSGTPVENNLMELWSIMDLLNPGLLGTRGDFRRTCAVPVAGGSGEAAEELRRRVRPFILRRKKEDVAKDLPEKEEVRYRVTMLPGQEKYYAARRDEGKARVRALLEGPEPWKALPVLLQVLTILRQTAIDSSLTGGPDESAKLDALDNMLEDVAAEGNKALIFSQFVRVLGKVSRRLDDKGLRYAYLDGKTRNREEQIRTFQDDPGCPFFLISLKAGGLGLNLTAADYVCIVDPWWNPAVERQAVDRAHRIGRKKKVIAYSLITEHSIEEKILELQEKKKALAEHIFSEEASVLKNLTPEEILGLFG